MNITFVAKFFGSVQDDFLPENFDVVFEKTSAHILVGDVNIPLETDFYPHQQELYFFFSIRGIIFRLRLYINENFTTGEIRKRIGYQLYELIYLIHTNKDQGLTADHNLQINNLYFYKEYWKELMESK
jgi:hypothetical protein